MLALILSELLKLNFSGKLFSISLRLRMWKHTLGVIVKKKIISLCQLHIQTKLGNFSSPSLTPTFLSTAIKAKKSMKKKC